MAPGSSPLHLNICCYTVSTWVCYRTGHSPSPIPMLICGMRHAASRKAWDRFAQQTWMCPDSRPLDWSLLIIPAGSRQQHHTLRGAPRSSSLSRVRPTLSISDAKPPLTWREPRRRSTPLHQLHPTLTRTLVHPSTSTSLYTVSQAYYCYHSDCGLSSHPASPSGPGLVVVPERHQGFGTENVGTKTFT